MMDHLAVFDTPEFSFSNISAFGTFFGWVIYLQYRINLAVTEYEPDSGVKA